MSFKKLNIKNLALQSAFLLALSSGGSFAAIQDAAPQNTAAQKEFSKFVSGGQFTEALMAWNSAFGQSAFSKSDTGVALQALLLAKSGLPVFGAHWVSADTNFNKISSHLKNEVLEIVKQNAAHLSSKTAHKSWKNIIDDHSPIVVKTNNDLKRLSQRLKKVGKKDRNEKARLLWAMSVGAAKLDKIKNAEASIRELKGLNQDLVGEDKIEMQLARVLFQKNQLNEAIDSYSLIPKSSEFWLDAVEERAWAYLRIGNYDKARSDITTLLAPTFKDYASAEVYVLAAITNLRICDYPQILEDSAKFKERHLGRIQEMEALADKGVNRHISEILTRMDQTGADLSAAAGKLASLPRMALRSQDFSQAVSTRSQLLKEVQKGQALLSRLQVMGGLTALAQLNEWAHKEAQTLRAKSLQTLKTLAANEVKEYRVMVNKLKLAEVEVIHRFNIDENLQGKRGELGSMSHGKNKIVFPYTDEVWIDELDNYQARVKDCPTTKGASL